MPTPSIDAGNSPSPKARRDLRDSWLFRLAVLVVALLAAVAASRSCAAQGRNVSEDEAVAIARESVDFVPDDHQVRFLQQGIPPQPVWVVALFEVNDKGQRTRTRTVIVHASSGEIVTP